jgi:hypothetical protein
MQKCCGKVRTLVEKFEGLAVVRELYALVDLPPGTEAMTRSIYELD